MRNLFSCVSWVFDMECVACLDARNEKRKVCSLYLIGHVCSIKILAGKGFCEVFLPLQIHFVVKY